MATEDKKDVVEFSVKDMHDSVARCMFRAALAEAVSVLTDNNKDPTIKVIQALQLDYRLLVGFCVAQGVLSRDTIDAISTTKAGAGMAEQVRRMMQTVEDHTKFELVAKAPEIA